MKFLYTKTKMFHFQERLDMLPRECDSIPAPIHIRLKPTNLCCHNCHYCAYSEKNMATFGKDKVNRVQIPEEKIMEIIQDIIEMDVKAITFSGGGEPFIYPHLTQVLKVLQETNIKFAALTNGSRLCGEAAEIFAAFGTWVRVSMDGWDDASYMKFRGVPDGEFTRIMKNMKDFIKLKGNCALGVSLIIGNLNYKHIYTMLSKLKDIGVNSVKLSPCLVSDKPRESNEFHEEFFDDARKEIDLSVSKLQDENFEISDAYNELSEKYDKNYTWCPHIQLRPVIGADLNVYTCPDKAYNMREGLLGSIRDKRFKEFWYEDKQKFFDVNPSKDCNHHCEVNPRNVLLWEYLYADEEHLNFI